MAKSDVLVRMKADTTGYDANIAKARRQLDQFKRDNLTAGGALKQLSGTLMSTAAKFASVTAAVGALGMAFKNNIETARNFEKSMSQLSSLTGMVGNDLGKLKEYAIELGSSTTLSASQVADAFKMMCLGANGVFVGKVLIQLLGCVGNEQGRCNSCNTGKCPTGICTQDPRLVKRLDVDKGAQKIVDYVLAFDTELKKLMAPIGNSSLPIGRSDALVSTDKAVAEKLGLQYVC